MNKVYVCGDTHGDIDIHKLNTKKWPEQRTLDKDDYLIILGDAGVVWDGARQDNYIQKWYKQKNFTTLFVDGNHENFDLLNNYPVIEKFGGKVQQINTSLFHLMRGEIYTICGKTFFVMGGAESHDKQFRTPFITWWPQEIPDCMDMEYGLSNLEKVDNKVDFILSHCTSQIVKRIMFPTIYDSDIMNKYLENVYSCTEFSGAYFGHYHEDIDISKYHCVYQRVIKII